MEGHQEQLLGLGEDGRDAEKEPCFSGLPRRLSQLVGHLMRLSNRLCEIRLAVHDIKGTVD